MSELFISCLITFVIGLFLGAGIIAVLWLYSTKDLFEEARTHMLNNLPKGGIVNGTYEDNIVRDERVVSPDEMKELRKHVKAGKGAKRYGVTLEELREIMQKKTIASEEHRK